MTLVFFLSPSKTLSFRGLKVPEEMMMEEQEPRRWASRLLMREERTRRQHSLNDNPTLASISKSNQEKTRNWLRWWNMKRMKCVCDQNWYIFFVTDVEVWCLRHSEVMSTFLLGSFFPSCKPIHLTYFLLLFLPHSLTYDCVSDFFTFDLSNRTDSRNYNYSLHTLKIVAECRFVTFIHVERKGEKERGEERWETNYS